MLWAVIWSNNVWTQNSWESWIRETHTHFNFPLKATHLSSSMWYPRCQNTPRLKMNIKTEWKHIWSLTDLDTWGNNGRMRGTKWVPCGGGQIPVLTAVVMVQLQDQGCSSFHRIKLIQIVHLLLHLRHLNVSANKHSCMTLHAVCCELTFEPTVTNVTMFFTIPNCLSAFVIKILL